MKYFTSIALSVVILLVNPAHSQNLNLGGQKFIPLFLQNSYFEVVPYAFDKDKAFIYVFEARTAPHFFIYQNIREKLLSKDSADFRVVRTGEDRIGGHLQTNEFIRMHAWDLSLTPEFVVRMYNIESLPVRRPNFRPYLNFNFYRIERWKYPIQKAFSIKSVTLRLTHYSNGQEGCLFSSETSIEKNNGTFKSFECQNQPANIYDAALNTINGEYTSTFLTLGANYKRISKVDSNGIELSYYRVGTYFDYHQDWGLFGEATAIQREIYNANKLTLHFDYMHRFKWEFNGKLDIFPGVGGINDKTTTIDNKISPVAVEATLVRYFKKADSFRSWGVFVRYHGFQDYYNINFRDSIHRITIGIKVQSDNKLRLAKFSKVK